MKSIIKAVQSAMEEHLVNLLFQQFKQYNFLMGLKGMGFDFAETNAIDNWNTVLDLIGFPKEISKAVNEEGCNIPLEYFSRERFFDNYLETVNEIPVKPMLSISGTGSLKTEDCFDIDLARMVLSKHVNWLFQEYANFLELQLN